MADGSIDKTLAERGSRYGSFKGHATITQALKLFMQGRGTLTTIDGGESVTLTVQTNWEDLTPVQQEALEMIVHKIGRIINPGADPNYDDSWRDIAGYAQLVVDQINGKNT